MVRLQSNFLRTRQRSQVARDLLIDGCRKPTGLAFLVCEELAKDRTVLKSAAVICTLIDSLLENVDFPPINEVSVEAVSGPVALSEDERLLAVTPPTVRKEVGLIDNLIEDGDQLDRM